MGIIELDMTLGDLHACLMKIVEVANEATKGSL